MTNKEKTKTHPVGWTLRRLAVTGNVTFLALFLAYVFWGEPTSNVPSQSAGITTTGIGSVEVIANVVFVDLAIVTDHESATQALSSNNKQMTQVFKTLEDNDILKAGGKRHMRATRSL